MTLTKRTSRNQVTIPKEIADRFPGIEYFEVSTRDKEIILRPVKLEEDTLSVIRDKMSRLGIKKRDIDEAIRWSRKQ